MILIGSRAMAAQLKLKNRTNLNTDFDVIMSIEQFMTWQETNKSKIISMIPRSMNKYKVIANGVNGRIQYEIELALEGTSAKLLLNNKDKVCKGYVAGSFGEYYGALSLEYLILTKRSHLIYPIHFEKNIEDYHMMKSICSMLEKNELMEEYYSLRYNEAKERNNQRTPNLNVTTEDFFSSKLPVQNYFVHDHIHEMMSHYERPIFTMMQKDSSKAWCEKDMFFDLPYEYRVKCVMEEAYVIALERYIIPQYGEKCEDYFDCYKRAVKRICTTLTSGWFRDFAIENYNKVIDWYNPEFVNNFIINIYKGRIKPKGDWQVNQIPLIAKGEK